MRIGEQVLNVWISIFVCFWYLLCDPVKSTQSWKIGLSNAAESGRGDRKEHLKKKSSQMMHVKLSYDF